MNSVPQHLQREDLQEFERLLDKALRSAPDRPELAAVGQRLNSEQLRSTALSASALITAAAVAEYQHYVTLRDALRQPAPSGPPGNSEEGDAGSSTSGLATTVGEAAESSGAGAIAVIAVLAPVLSGTAAVIFLLVGYILRVVDPGLTLARTLLTTGWVFGAITAATILVAAVALLLTALRNGTSANDHARDAARDELATAKEAWQNALLERGILPFLQEAIAAPGTTAGTLWTPSAPTGHIPRLGYDRPGYGRPGFTSPDDKTATGRPSFTSPDYTSPDFGGPEHQPE